MAHSLAIRLRNKDPVEVDLQLPVEDQFKQIRDRAAQSVDNQLAAISSPTTVPHQLTVASQDFDDQDNFPLNLAGGLDTDPASLQTISNQSSSTDNTSSSFDIIPAATASIDSGQQLTSGDSHPALPFQTTTFNPHSHDIPGKTSDNLPIADAKESRSSTPDSFQTPHRQNNSSHSSLLSDNDDDNIDDTNSCARDWFVSYTSEEVNDLFDVDKPFLSESDRDFIENNCIYFRPSDAILVTYLQKNLADREIIVEYLNDSIYKYPFIDLVYSEGQETLSQVDPGISEKLDIFYAEDSHITELLQDIVLASFRSQKLCSFDDRTALINSLSKALDKQYSIAINILEHLYRELVRHLNTVEPHDSLEQAQPPIEQIIQQCRDQHLEEDFPPELRLPPDFLKHNPSGSISFQYQQAVDAFVLLRAPNNRRRANPQPQPNTGGPPPQPPNPPPPPPLPRMNRNLRNNQNNQLQALLQGLQQLVIDQNTNATTARQDSRKYEMFPKTMFSGDTISLAKPHWQAFEKYLLVQRDNNRLPANNVQDIIEAFQSTLTDHAYSWLDSVKAQIASEDDLRKLFLARYNKWGQNERDFALAWSTLKFQPSHQTVEQFSDECKTLGSLNGLNDVQILTKFKQGFSKPIEAQLTASPTMDTAIDLARTLCGIYRGSESAAGTTTPSGVLTHHYPYSPAQPNLEFNQHEFPQQNPTRPPFKSNFRPPPHRANNNNNNYPNRFSNYPSPRPYRSNNFRPPTNSRFTPRPFPRSNPYPRRRFQYSQPSRTRRWQQSTSRQPTRNFSNPNSTFPTANSNPDFTTCRHCNGAGHYVHQCPQVQYEISNLMNSLTKEQTQDSFLHQNTPFQ